MPPVMSEHAYEGVMATVIILITPEPETYLPTQFHRRSLVALAQQCCLLIVTCAVKVLFIRGNMTFTTSKRTISKFINKVSFLTIKKISYTYGVTTREFVSVLLRARFFVNLFIL